MLEANGAVAAYIPIIETFGFNNDPKGEFVATSWGHEKARSPFDGIPYATLGSVNAGRLSRNTSQLATPTE